MDDYDKTRCFWVKKQIKTDSDLAAAMNSHCISYAYHSGKLENEMITYNDTREIFEHDGVVAYTGDLRTLFEIRNAKTAYEYMLSAFGEKKWIDEGFVKGIQRCLTLNTYDTRRWKVGERPGEYKKHDYVTGRNEVGALPEEVHEEMSELLEELSVDFPKEKVLTVAAYFHAKFENIHPFADGNGRTGRLVMNYLLLLNDHPPIVIHEEDRKAYYAALEAWDTEQKLDLLIEFLKDQTVKTWIKQVEKAEN